MKAIFVTDIHGVRWKYERLAQLAINHRVDVVLDGGDILPYAEQEREEDFLRWFVADIVRKMYQARIKFVFIYGNEDSPLLDSWFDGQTTDYPLMQATYNIAGRMLSLGRFDFIGMNWVANHPFRLKDRCRLDYPLMRLEKHYGTALLSRGIGEYQEIADWGAYIQKLPTLEQELEKLPLPRRRAKAVYLIHHPPWHLGLATTLRPEGLADVGSKAVYDFIATRQPWLTFHGHIHDSPLRTDTWQAKLDDTLCIQPGQSLTKDNERDKLIYVLIDLKTRAAKRFEEARLI